MFFVLFFYTSGEASSDCAILRHGLNPSKPKKQTLNLVLEEFLLSTVFFPPETYFQIILYPEIKETKH